MYTRKLICSLFLTSTVWLIIIGTCTGCKSTADDHKSYSQSVLKSFISGDLDSFLDLSVFNASVEEVRTALSVNIQKEIDKANLKIDTSFTSMADKAIFKTDPNEVESEYYLAKHCVDQIILDMYTEGAMNRIDKEKFSQLVDHARSCVITRTKDRCTMLKMSKSQCTKAEKEAIKEFNEKVVNKSDDIQRERLNFKYRFARYFTKIETQIIKAGISMSDLVFKDIVIEDDFLDKSLKGYVVGILVSHKKETFGIKLEVININGTLALTKARWQGKNN